MEQPAVMETRPPRMPLQTAPTSQVLEPRSLSRATTVRPPVAAESVVVTMERAAFGGDAVSCDAGAVGAKGKTTEDAEEAVGSEVPAEALGAVHDVARTPVELLQQTVAKLRLRSDGPIVIQAMLEHELAPQIADRITPKAFGALISSVCNTYDKVPSALILAKAMTNFRCAHLIATLGAAGVGAVRPNLVAALSPCVPV